MEAKETVIDYDGEEVGIILREVTDERVSDALVNKLLQVQAELSFKAGIKEVVDLILPCAEYHAHANLLDFVGVPLDKWQAKLKEWGIE